MSKVRYQGYIGKQNQQKYEIIKYMNTLSCSSSKASYYIYDKINQINE